MADEARTGTSALGRSAELSQLLAAVRALIAALAVGATLLLTFRSDVLHALPNYPAVVVAFLVITCLPGYVIQRALLEDAHAFVKMAAMPALGLGVMALPGFYALEANTSMDTFATLYALFAAVCAGAAAFFWPDGKSDAPAGAWRANLFIVAALLVGVGGIATTPYWAQDRVSGDFDDWTYMAYASDYVEDDEMNATEPFFGTDDPPTPRMRSNVWVLAEAFVADVAGVSVHDVLLEDLRPVLSVLALLTTFALTWTLFRNATVALLAAVFQLGYALIDLSPHEGMGRNVLLRISEDKMVGAFILFPIALVFVARFVERRTFASGAGFAIIVLAIAFVHPVPLAFLGITIGALAVIRFAQDRDLRAALLLLALLVPVAVGSIWPLVQRQLLQDSAPELFGTEESAITFRDSFRVVELGQGLVIGNYHMIIHPLMIAAILLTGLAWRLGRRQLGNQMLLALTGGAVVAFFVPVFSTPLSNVMTPQTLWKVPWMIPVGPVLGLLTYEASMAVARTNWLASRHLFAGAAIGFMPAVIVVALLGGALLVQEQYIRADGGAFYDWRRGDSFLPGPDDSIFLGGVDRALSGTWRLDPFLKDLVAHVDENVPPGSVLLAEPQQLNHMIPGLVPDVHPVDFGGAAGEGDRREDVTLFIQGQLGQGDLDRVIDRWGIDYILVRETESANQPLITYYRTELQTDIVPYLVYEVIQ